MFLQLFLLIMACIAAAGCAVTEKAYDPLAAQTTGTFELNASALKKVTIGMTQEEAHRILGESIIIGYTYPKDASKQAAAPITLKNPYKTVQVNGPKGACTEEYYVTSVIVPDGTVNDNELYPLTFCGGTLISKGWNKPK